MQYIKTQPQASPAAVLSDTEEKLYWTFPMGCATLPTGNQALACEFEEERERI